MKRLLQGLAILQVLLIVAIGVRIVSVWTTPLPEVGEIPELPAVSTLPPPKPPQKVSDAVTAAIVEHDLFEEQRGHAEVAPEDVTVEGPPVPPPTTVKLMGVMVLGNEPVAILLDSSVQPEQKSVRKGEMFGEYEVGEITRTGLLLLGSQGQQFQVPLRLEAGMGGTAPIAGPPPPGSPAAPRTPGTPPASRVTPPKPPGVARATTTKNEAGADPDKAMTARERAQAIAQRNAEMRKQNQKGNAAGNEEAAEGGDANQPNPVQARLEALRQLREAAKAR